MTITDITYHNKEWSIDIYVESQILGGNIYQMHIKTMAKLRCSDSVWSTHSACKALSRTKRIYKHCIWHSLSCNISPSHLFIGYFCPWIVVAHLLRFSVYLMPFQSLAAHPPYPLTNHMLLCTDLWDRWHQCAMACLHTLPRPRSIEQSSAIGPTQLISELEDTERF